MRALHVPAAGAQPQLSELPIPQVADGTVLVRVIANGNARGKIVIKISD
jgi:NADPH:quinone reductase-like Zn-dependent oxidoreductase